MEHFQVSNILTQLADQSDHKRPILRMITNRVGFTILRKYSNFQLTKAIQTINNMIN